MTHSSSDLYTSVSDSREKVVLKRTTEVENYWDKFLQKADENGRQEIVHLRHVTSKSERKCIVKTRRLEGDRTVYLYPTPLAKYLDVKGVWFELVLSSQRLAVWDPAITAKSDKGSSAFDNGACEAVTVLWDCILLWVRAMLSTVCALCVDSSWIVQKDAETDNHCPGWDSVGKLWSATPSTSDLVMG